MAQTYVRPGSVAEAVHALAEHPGRSDVVAGATDLLMDVRMKGRSTNVLVDINDLSELRGVREEDGGLVIGALTPMTALAASDLVRRLYSALADAAGEVGSPQIRNLATIGGNVVHATPSAETGAPLLVLNAAATLVGPGGTRTVPLDGFFTGPGASVRAPDEILTEIRIPWPPGGSAYLRQCTRGALDIATVGVACALTVEDGVISAARVALAAVAPTPIRSVAAEAALLGSTPSDEVFAEAARRAVGDARPITDVRASAEYRTAMVGVLTERALHLAVDRTASERGKK